MRMNKIAIMQPYFFPYLGYFQLIDKVDQFLLYPHVDFRRRSFISRNHLVTPSNEVFPICINTKKAPLGTSINDIQMSPDFDRLKLLRQIQTLYSNAPYFESIFNVLKNLLEYDSKGLLDFNNRCIATLCHHLGIDTPILSGIEFDQDWLEVETVIRAEHPNLSTFPIATKRVLALCQLHNADTYVNPPGGRAIYKADDFASRNKSLLFLNPDITKHRSTQETVLQSASIIDVLMVNGWHNTKEIVRLGNLIT